MITGGLRRCRRDSMSVIYESKLPSSHPPAPCIPPVLTNRRGKGTWLASAALRSARISSHTSVCCGILASRALHPTRSDKPSRKRDVAGFCGVAPGPFNPHILQYAAVELPRAPCIPPVLTNRRGKGTWPVSAALRPGLSILTYYSMLRLNCLARLASRPF